MSDDIVQLESLRARVGAGTVSIDSDGPVYSIAAVQVRVGGSKGFLMRVFVGGGVVTTDYAEATEEQVLIAARKAGALRA